MGRKEEGGEGEWEGGEGEWEGGEVGRKEEGGEGWQREAERRGEGRGREQLATQTLLGCSNLPQRDATLNTENTRCTNGMHVGKDSSIRQWSMHIDNQQCQ